MTIINHGKEESHKPGFTNAFFSSLSTFASVLRQEFVPFRDHNLVPPTAAPAPTFAVAALVGTMGFKG